MSSPHYLLSCVADQRLHLEASGKCRGLYLQGHPPNIGTKIMLAETGRLSKLKKFYGIRPIKRLRNSL